jgi:signal transduction histidine kinase
MWWDVLLPQLRELVRREQSIGSRVRNDQRRSRVAPSWFVLICASLCLGPGSHAATDVIRGLPFTRSYPLEEIGNVPKGARFSFDAFGRLAAVYPGVYSVLNDTVWLDLADKEGDRSITMSNVVQGGDGRLYYSARGSWGTVEIAGNGRLRPSPLTPADQPEWTLTCPFVDVVPTRDGIYFGGWGGVVVWDFARNENRFYEFNSVARIFSLGDRVFVSCHGEPFYYIDLERDEIRALPETAAASVAVEVTTHLDAERVLIALRNGQLVEFDGRATSPWIGQVRSDLTGFISGLHRLVDGDIAVAITGKGLFLVSPEGELRSALTTPQYHRITDLATREPGVLWVATEDAIEKVLYGSPLTSFGQRLGLPISWPVVVRWNDRILVSSSGQLYEAVTGLPGTPARFQPVEEQPPGGAWAIAASGSRMLIGNAQGVFEATRDGQFKRVAATHDAGYNEVAYLAMVGDDLCFVLGRVEIAVLRHANGEWSECAPRISAIGRPAVIRPTKRSVWIELGANKVARVALRGGKLELRSFEQFPWKGTPWVNVGVVDDTVVLSGPEGERMYFDETTEAFRDAPELGRLLQRSPYWINRVLNDDTGTLWASHDQGVVVFTPRDGDYDIDSTSFDLINDHYPFVQILAGNDVWLSAGRSLHHVERRRAPEAERSLQPMLVSVLDGRTNAELFTRTEASAEPVQLPFARNSLSFRFFSGGYGWRRAPVYEFRLNGGERWTTLGSGSLLSFPELREGKYRLEVRLAQRQRATNAPTVFEFAISPPWHRTASAYAAYGLGLTVAVFGIVRWTSHRARRRNLVLEKVIQERTGQLKEAMEKLNEEARNAATLAERDRLAGEIHDSLQQGLSGLMLQLDATLKLPSISSDVRSRLNVARNMVSFTRHEVQHAIWDMESPLLDNADLGEALRKLTALINSGATAVDIVVTGPSISLSPAITHHLLRIAQEAITNAVRHASARQISIRLEYGSGAVSLSITDDGSGFDPAFVMSNSVGHFGLRGLRARAAKIGGELLIQSSPGRGTSIRVCLSAPLPHPLSSSDATSAPKF